MSIFFAPTQRVDELRHDHSAGPDCQVFLDNTYLDEVALLRFQVRGTQRSVHCYHQPHYSTVLLGQETVYGQLVAWRIVDNYLARMQAGEEIREVGGGPSPTTQLSEFLEPNALLPIPDWVKEHLWSHFNVETTNAVDETIAELRHLSSADTLGTRDVQRRREVVDRLNTFKSAVRRIFTDWEIQTHPTTPELRLPMPKLTAGLTNVSQTGVRVGKTSLSDFSLDPFRLTVFFGVFGDMNASDLTVSVGTLDHVVLTGHSQVIQTSAEAVAVSYEFMASVYNEQVY